LPLLYWAGVVRYGRGELLSALELFDTAVEIARIAEHDRGLAWNLAARSLVVNAMGDRAEALSNAREAVERAQDPKAALPAVPACLCYATVLAEGADYEPALHELRRFVAIDAPTALPLRWQPDWYELLTRCLAGLGQLAASNRAVSHAEQAARRLNLPSAHGAAERAATTVTLAEGDPLAAQHHAARAIAAFREAGAALQADRCRLLLGEALACSGEHQRAIEELTAAAAQLEARGALRWRGDAEQLLRRLGHRRHRRTPRAPHDGTTLAALTGREREVVMLAARGRTNPQIAAELFLSTKTVETHLRNAFHKLNVSSRLELARLVDTDIQS
jgi:ATP/maltotriose-dependent transcriptional regulator MalT